MVVDDAGFLSSILLFLDEIKGFFWSRHIGFIYLIVSSTTDQTHISVGVMARQIHASQLGDCISITPLIPIGQSFPPGAVLANQIKKTALKPLVSY